MKPKVLELRVLSYRFAIDEVRLPKELAVPKGSVLYYDLRKHPELFERAKRALRKCGLPEPRTLAVYEYTSESAFFHQLLTDVDASRCPEVCEVIGCTDIIPFYVQLNVVFEVPEELAERLPKVATIKSARIECFSRILGMKRGRRFSFIFSKRKRRLYAGISLPVDCVKESVLTEVFKAAVAKLMESASTGES